MNKILGTHEDLDNYLRCIVKVYCKYYNTPHYKLAKELGINKRHFDTWWKGKTSIRFLEACKLKSIGVVFKIVNKNDSLEVLL